MTSRRRDDRTLDLLAWEPPRLTLGADPLIRAESLKDRISRAVALVMKECDLSREEISARMNAFLGGEEVSVAMLNKYASQAAEDHSIPAHRLTALADATGDDRALQVMIAPLDKTVIPTRFVPAIEDAILDDKINELTQRRATARRSWKGPR